MKRLTVFNAHLLVVFAVIIAGCSPEELAATTETTPSEQISYSDITETATPESTLTPLSLTPTGKTDEDSLLLLKEGKMTIEVIRKRIYNDPGFTQVFTFGLRFSGTPQTPISNSADFYPVKEIKFFLSDDDQAISFELQQIGGGGGGPGFLENGTVSINQDFSYEVVTPLSSGLNRHIIAVVTLDDVFGVSTPIRFDLMIVPE